MSLEDTQKIINGASLIGAGRTLGLTDDETLETKRATLRRQQRERRAQRGQREGNRAAAEQFLADDAASFQTKGRNRTTDGKVRGVRVDEDYPDPFGGYEERVYDDDGVLRETRRAEEDFQTYSSEEAERYGVRQQTSGSRDDVDDGLLQERGNYVTYGRGTEGEKRFWREGVKVTPAGKKGAESRADRPARPRLFMKPENAAGSRRPDFAKGSQRDIKVAPNTTQGARAKKEDAVMRSLVSELGRADREGPSSSVVQSEVARRLRREFSGNDTPGSAVRSMPIDAYKQRQQELTNQIANTGFNPEMQQYRQYLAEAEAQRIAQNRFGINGGGAAADENIGYIQEIRSLGTAGPAGHGFTGNIQVVTPNNQNNFGIASPLTRQGEIVGYYGDVDGDMVQLGEVNSVSTRNTLNVPEFTPGQEWVVGNRPNMASPGGTSFGMPQVNIRQEIGQFGERMRALGMGMENFQTPRSLPEFEAAIRSVLARGAAAGDTFYRKDPATGKAVVVAEPGIDDVLYRMRYTQNEKQALANALLQLDTSLNRDVNLDRKEAFLARRPQTLSEQPIFKGVEPESSTPLAKIKNEKVGRGKKRESVGAALRALNEQAVVDALSARGELATPGGVMLPNAARQIAAAAEGRGDAMRPFIGAVEGEGAPRAQFIRGQDRNKSRTELQAQFGEEQGGIAYEVEQRYLRDQERKRNASQTDEFAARQRATDARFEAEGQRVSDEFAQSELAKLRGNAGVPGTPTPRGFAVQKQAAYAEDAAPKAPGSWMGGPGRGSVVSAWDKNPDPKPTQRIQQAPVPKSIAPDPWAASSSFDAAISREIQKRGPQQTDSSKYYMTLPDGPGSEPPTGMKRRAISDQINRTNKIRKFGTIGAAALGTVLGLSTLGKDEEEEDRYYG